MTIKEFLKKLDEKKTCGELMAVVSEDFQKLKHQDQIKLIQKIWKAIIPVIRDNS